jgi:putative peptide maturation dehydrogenase
MQASGCDGPPQLHPGWLEAGTLTACLRAAEPVQNNGPSAWNIAMELRRCTALVVERRRAWELRLGDFLTGDAGVGQRECWIALAPHLGVEVEVSLGELAIIEAVGVDDATDRALLEKRFDPAAVARLVDAGLLIGDHDTHSAFRARDADVERAAWWTPAAVAQVFGRWHDENVEADEAKFGPRKVSAMIAANGLPPEAAPRRRDAADGLPLPAPRKTWIDALLAQRATCRNFDPAPVPLQDLADLLHRVFGAQAEQTLAQGMVALKKNSPSGGGLHPVEAYLLVQRVDGLSPGLYHYHCTTHTLEPLGILEAADAAVHAHALVAGQPWFAAAPVLVVMVARFERIFWKYRLHPKAWKVVQLDAGHLSQNLYLSATELGHGAFVTGAINDAVAEALFGLDGLLEGPVVVGGFGRRIAGGYRELDPLNRAVT